MLLMYGEGVGGGRGGGKGIMRLWVGGNSDKG